MTLNILQFWTYYYAEAISSLRLILTRVMTKDEHKECGVVLPSFQAQK